MKYLIALSALAVLFLTEKFMLNNETPVQQVFIYEKSNLDGSNKGLIAVYYEAADQLEAFKWHEGYQQATIVRAGMDLENHTVKRFEAYSMDHLGNTQLRGELDVQDDLTIKLKFGDQEQLFEDAPTLWHSYDFDFTSLGYAFQSRKNLRKPFDFRILDIDMRDSPPKFKDFGEVELRFLQKEEKWGRKLLKYSIDGPGLDHRGGHIWFDQKEGFLVAFEIEKPDEPGYESGKLLLKEVRKMNKEAWAAFKTEVLQPE